MIGAPIPGLNILSRYIYNVKASTIDASLKQIEKRVLCPDFHENNDIDSLNE